MVHLTARIYSMYAQDEFVYWFRWSLGVIAAVGVALLLSVYIQRDNQIAGCVRNDQSKLIDAKFYESAAQKNFIVANQESTPHGESLANRKAGNEYVALSVAKRATIPMPKGWQGDPLIRGNNRHDRLIGCQQAYPPPIPFIR